MKHSNQIRIKRLRRHRRVRSKVVGTASRPRLSVFRSNRAVYAQLIDDDAKRTLVGVHSLTTSVPVKKGTPKKDAARVVGRELARLALERDIKRILFDRGGYKYHGRVRALAEGAREGGLEF